MMNSENTVTKHPGRWLLIGPCVIVFVASFCVLAIELVAGRIAAKQLGPSLYTWTSVIGVVLMGLTIGNYLGGSAADRFKTISLIPVLLVLSSAGCLITIIASNTIPLWYYLWNFEWPVRVFLHVLCIFLLPSILFGLISPVIAKSALEKGLATGRTVGDIYAWGAAGSIAGTFATGYFLITAIGTQAIIWLSAIVMLLFALFYGYRTRLVRIYLVIFICVIILGFVPAQWLSSLAISLGLRPQRISNIIYEDETPYCYVAISSEGGRPELRIFQQDTLIHSKIIMGDISNLQYSYENIMAAVTRHFVKDKKNLAFLQLGGGGYVFPRYLEYYWPDSRIDVVEIDPGVTFAAQKAFGLDPNTKINTIPLDARNYVDQLCHQAKSGKDTLKYNFIYEDALNNLCVPYQLTTYEFNQKLNHLLTEDGIYMVELIDRLDSSLFLGSFVNTVKCTFPFVTVILSTNRRPENRNVFVIIAAKKPLNIDNVFKESGLSESYLFLPSDTLNEINEKSKGIVLTDDYAPVENLLAPVAKTQAIFNKSALVIHKSRKLAKQAEKLARAGKLFLTLEKLDELIKADPSMTIKAYAVMARIFAENNRVDDVLQIYQAAADKYSGQEQFKYDFAELNFNWAILLQKIGKPDDSNSHFIISANICDEILAKEPNSTQSHFHLGQISANLGNFAKAAAHFHKAVDLAPDNYQYNFYLIKSLEAQQLLDEAIEQASVSAQYFSNAGRKDEASKMQEYLQYLRQQKASH